MKVTLLLNSLMLFDTLAWGPNGATERKAVFTLTGKIRGFRPDTTRTSDTALSSSDANPAHANEADKAAQFQQSERFYKSHDSLNFTPIEIGMHELMVKFMFYTTTCLHKQNCLVFAQVIVMW